MIIEGALGKQLLGKKREPLDVATIRQTSRSAALKRGRVSAERARVKTRARPGVTTVSVVQQHGAHPMAGVARAIDAGLGSGGIVKGTPTHMAPEQVRGEKDDNIPNPQHPKITGGSAQRQAQKLARHAGISSVACKGPSGTYSSSKGCAQGHTQLGPRIHPSIRKPSIQAPRSPAPIRTQIAMRRAGAHQSVT